MFLYTCWIWICGYARGQATILGGFCDDWNSWNISEIQGLENPLTSKYGWKKQFPALSLIILEGFCGPVPLRTVPFALDKFFLQTSGLKSNLDKIRARTFDFRQFIRWILILHFFAAASARWSSLTRESADSKKWKNLLAISIVRHASRNLSLSWDRVENCFENASPFTLPAIARLTSCPSKICSGMPPSMDLWI